MVLSKIGNKCNGLNCFPQKKNMFASGCSEYDLVYR